MIVARLANRARREYSLLRDADGQERVSRFFRSYFPRVLFLLSLPLLIVLAALLRVFLLLLKPLVHIRFGRLWSFQMGGYAFLGELYLCELDAGAYPKRSWDVFYHHLYDHYVRDMAQPAKPEKLIANIQMDTMFRRRLRVAEITRPLDNLNRLLPGGSQFSIAMPVPYDKYGLLDRFPAHLTFTQEEEEQGREALASMGVDPEATFVCFYARDGVWIRRAHQKREGEWNLGEERNSSIGSYLQCAEKLTDLGYYAIRVGKYVAEEITPPNSKVIDYSTNFHSDFMDMYLSARCAFFIGNHGGMITLPLLFRRPLITVNITPLGTGYETGSYKHGLMINKMIYSSDKEGLLTLRETFNQRFARLGIGQAEEKAYFDRMGFQLVDNTPEEIMEVAVEMHQRTQGTFTPTKEEEDLHKRWLSIVLDYPEVVQLEPGREKAIRMGSHFLRTYQDWLE